MKGVNVGRERVEKGNGYYKLYCQLVEESSSVWLTTLQVVYDY